MSSGIQLGAAWRSRRARARYHALLRSYCLHDNARARSVMIGMYIVEQ